MTTRPQTMTSRGLSPDSGPACPDRLCRRSEVLRTLAIKDEKLRELIDQGAFPEPIQLGPRTSVWLESEVQAFLTRMAKDRRLPNSSRA